MTVVCLSTEVSAQLPVGELTFIPYGGIVFIIKMNTESEALTMCADHTSHSYGSQKDDLLKRLRRVEGQVRGIQKMIDEDRYCVDILVQIAAIKSALQQVGLTLLESHTRGCVVDAISNETDADIKIDELMDVIRQFTKS